MRTTYYNTVKPRLHYINAIYIYEKKVVACVQILAFLVRRYLVDTYLQETLRVKGIVFAPIVVRLLYF